MKILITGGHFTPALAVIQQLPKDITVIYVGRKHALEGDTAISLEYETMQQLGIPFREFSPARLQRKLTKHTLPSLRRFPKGMWQAFQILKEEKPDLILSFGGYVAFPFALAGKLQHIPVITHEQTLEAGGTNRLIAKLATKVCVSWPSSMQFFPKEKAVLTGNPLPKNEPTPQTLNMLSEIKEKYPLLVITGGSLGSHAINTFIEPIVEKLLAKYTIWHQTGDAKEFGDYDRLVRMREHFPQSFKDRYILQKFIQPNDISEIYKKATLVVSRSGMNTVEMLLLGNIPSLLIPLPYSQRQEQLKNALLLKDSGLGQVLEQKELTGDTLLRHIENMMQNIQIYTNHNLQDQKNLHMHAAANIIKVVYGTKAHNLSSQT